MQLQPTAAQLHIARFLHDVVRASAAWAVCHRGEPIVVHANEDFLPLWSSREAALHCQRRSWPQLTAAAVSLRELLVHFLPTSHERGIAIGIGICVKDEALLMIPADWLERALRAGMETRWRESARD